METFPICSLMWFNNEPSAHVALNIRFCMVCSNSIKQWFKKDTNCRNHLMTYCLQIDQVLVWGFKISGNFWRFLCRNSLGFKLWAGGSSHHSACAESASSLKANPTQKSGPDLKNQNLMKLASGFLVANAANAQQERNYWEEIFARELERRISEQLKYRESSQAWKLWIVGNWRCSSARGALNWIVTVV